MYINDHQVKGIVCLTPNELDGSLWMKRVKRSKYGKQSVAWMQGECQEYRMKVKRSARTEHMEKKLPHVASSLFETTNSITSCSIIFVNCKSFNSTVFLIYM
ncbi:hypothetical protein HanXRQr2_Chr13g0597461 [Helianthus annuus]|uniref:Uncharacterized protein n=1 Tax=Helianthus annuus TaxID=4232 RepID=A0A251SUL5_HELAN|nr:hypothetical protein HanXRQr2_Chr13g0597461 [Helianthus annuus]KAJ0849999.1 hypothetical protein HanPSC8_Chr13g0575511 [Helianthus annuus]